MGKRIEIDGKFYRMRRGKLVQIPDEWVGKTTWDSTKRKRKSHWVPKVKKGRNSWNHRTWRHPDSCCERYHRGKEKRDLEKFLLTDDED